MDTISKFYNQNFHLIKLTFIAFMALFLLIPVENIKSIINERRQLRQETINKIGESWGRSQTITSPILSIPYTETIYNSESKNSIKENVLFISSEELKLNANEDTDIKSLGIYDVVVYTANVGLEGYFDLSKLPNSSNIKYQYDNAKILIGISDPAAIASKVTCSINDVDVRNKPGLPFSTLTNGLNASIKLDPNNVKVSFKYNFDLRGSDRFSIIPMSKDAVIEMSSDWADPSFSGRNLPKAKTINKNGFKATWSANEFNSQVEDYWNDASLTLDSKEPNINVEFKQLADDYQKNMRSAKYALLIIALSFVTFFTFEFMLKRKIHPIQYILVGIALAIFYILLLAFTEHVGFNIAYVISALAVVFIIASYGHAIIKNLKSSMVLTGVLFGLYTYIFILLQLEDFALLAGAVGLFIILAAIMYASRNVNWYSIGNEKE